MGLQKRLWEEQEQRGYGFSDFYVCQSCFGDRYLKKYILDNGTQGKCSFCKDHNGKPARRKVLALEELMQPIMNAVRTYYIPAEDNACWDPEEKEYINPVENSEDVIYLLDDYMECASSDLLESIADIIAPTLLVDAGLIETSPEEMDLKLWHLFCDLVKNREKLSAEQIVSLCTRDDAPKDLREIRECLEMVLHHAQELRMYEIINTGTPIYRCVKGVEPPKDYEVKPATVIGTAPAKYVADNRMSEQGDMMFYGATDVETAMREVFGNDQAERCTIGEFHGNKRVFVLNLDNLATWKCPSIFDVENRKKRSIWLFLKEFINCISLPAEDKEDYKPTQVLTKYIQRKTKLHGIAYHSSKAPISTKRGSFADRCLVLFVTNRDCLDENEKTDAGRYQLIMDPNPRKFDESSVLEMIK